MFKTTKTKITTKKVSTKEIDKKNNLVDKKENRSCIVEQQNDTNETIVSKDYLYLEKIDEFYYIYGILDANPNIINDKNESLYKRKYGILKLNRDAYMRVIPYNEVVIVPALYDEIKKKGSNTLCVTNNNKSTYFDLSKEKQLTPIVFDLVSNFDFEYPGFAQCFYNYKAGYLPRSAKPVTDENDINLMDEVEVKALIDYQTDTDMFLKSNVKYKQLTGKSYIKQN